MPESPNIGADLNQGFQRAFELAKARRHEDVALEHLLLALLDDPHAAKALKGCSVRARSRRNSTLQSVKSSGRTRSSPGAATTSTAPSSCP